MRKLVVLSFISLDGVMQAPGGPEEDASGNFTYGGWTVPYFDEAAGAEMDKQMRQSFEMLLGRKTYDIFASYWPNQTDGPASVINNQKRYVVSNNSNLDISWKGTTLVSGDDIVAKITTLKEADGPMLQVHGSGNLIQTLLKNDLVDELWLKTFPVVLGSGKKLFAEGTQPVAFKMTSSTITPGGVIFANYSRDGDVKTGSF